MPGNAQAQKYMKVNQFPKRKNAFDVNKYLNIIYYSWVDNTRNGSMLRAAHVQTRAPHLPMISVCLEVLSMRAFVLKKSK